MIVASSLCENLYTVSQKKCATLTKGVQNVHHLHGHMPGDAFSTGEFLIDLQNSFAAARSDKFAIKPILVRPPNLKYVAALPWET